MTTVDRYPKGSCEQTTIVDAIHQLKPEFAIRSAQIDIIAQPFGYFSTIPRDIHEIIKSFVPDLRQSYCDQIEFINQQYKQFLSDYGSDQTDEIGEPAIDWDKLSTSPNLIICCDMPTPFNVVEIKIVDSKIYLYANIVVGYYDHLTLFNLTTSPIGIKIDPIWRLSNDTGKPITWHIKSDIDHRIRHILPCGLLCVDVGNDMFLVNPQTNQHARISHDYNRINKYARGLKSPHLLIDDFGIGTDINKNAANLSPHSPFLYRIILV